MPLDNQFTLAERYLPIIDDVYKAASKTSILDAANSDVKVVDAETIKLWKLSLNGMGNYDRSTGFVKGSATGTWESLKLTQDRGRSFSIDSASDIQSLGLPLGKTMGEFLRTQVAPELDAYRFAKYFASAGASASAAITVGTTDVPALIDAADESMSDNEVPTEGRILFVSEKCYNGLKAKITRYLRNEGDVSRNVEMYNDMRVIRVPQGRFYTKVTLLDGSTSGEEAGGYVGTASTGYKLNFMIVHPSAVCNVVNHVFNEPIAPQFNNSADAWLIRYRIYHDAFVLANKTHGIYAHYDTTALS